MHILLTIAYDGTAYAGWQRQKNAVAVQQRVEEALSKLYQTPLTVLGSSRTDAGVHALCQKAVVKVAHNPIPLARLPIALGAMLPEDIVVTHAEEVPPSFHPINDVVQKTYTYVYAFGAHYNPIVRRNRTFVPCCEPDVGAMQRAAKAFVGEHDFAAFCATGSTVQSTVRTIYDLTVTEQGDTVEIRVTGNGFLYNMVRILAGTLAYVGQGKLAPEAMAAIIQSKDRTQAGKTARAEGLTLVDVQFREGSK